MSDSVNDELEQLLDEWIESIMQEVRKARNGMQATTEHEAARAGIIRQGDKNPVAKEHRGEG